jgi:hypothetical protein
MWFEPISLRINNKIDKNKNDFERRWGNFVSINLSLYLGPTTLSIDSKGVKFNYTSFDVQHTG